MCSTGQILAKQVDALAAVPVQTLSVSDLMRFVADTTGPMNRLAGIVSRAVGELQVRGSGQVPDPAVAGAACPTSAWLRTVGQVSGHTAGRQLRTAVALRELPAVADTIVDGDLTVEHGRVLARLVGRIEPQALLDSQPQLIEVARRTDPEQLASFVRHLLATWCEPDLEADEAAAEDRRFLQVRNTHRGSWRGTFDLPDAAMEIVLPVLESLARRESQEDTRSAGQRRADALTDVFGLALRHSDLPDAGGSRPRLTYVAPELSTAPERFVVDVDRHPGADCAAGAWTGPATRTQIETLLCEARVERLDLDRNGQVVSLTSLTDEITAAQRRAVAARDRCCTAKGCSRPPAFCDVHHLRARADGGPTDIGNLVLLCRRHHVMWHRQQLTLTDLRIPWMRVPQQPRAPARR
jgi:5-methylcytosine-specific restriction protein A